MVEFHEKLQELRREKGLTQEELAEDLYVSRTALSREAYAATLVFLMLVVKGMLMLRCYGIIEPSKR